MIGITLFDFSKETIKKELLKDSEIPENIIDFKLDYWILNHYFRDYIICNKQNAYIRGYPDFELIHNSSGETIFVEFKKGLDGLRKDQLEFMFKNKKNCFVIYYEQIKSEYELNKFQKMIEKFKLQE